MNISNRDFLSAMRDPRARSLLATIERTDRWARGAVSDGCAAHDGTPDDECGSCHEHVTFLTVRFLGVG